MQVMQKGEWGSTAMVTVLLLASPLALLFYFSPCSLKRLSNPLSSSKLFLDGNIRAFLIQILAASSIGFIAAAAVQYRHQKRPMRDRKFIPRLHVTGSGHLNRLERFSQYVARQMGFEDTNECPQLCKLAYDYLRKSKGCEDSIHAFFVNDPNAESLFIKLVEELERCILGYFAFHWSQASLMISQVLSVDSEPKTKLKNIVMAATRKQRFDKVTKALKATRLFSTLVTEMKAIGITSNKESQCTDVMVPAAHSDRSPVLLLLGGGMGAGKSTVLKDILKEPFWLGAAENAVVVEADAFKETDVIYRALSSRGHHDMLHTAELVHQSSTDAASSLLVTALNEGRDVIMDGTLSWGPFVQQTIAMARNIHHRRYRMGVGYKVAEDGTITENYWEQVEEQERKDAAKNRKPYRIELVGVVCDPYLAVVRGIRRAILMGRAVRVNSQLQSHKRFANGFHDYCQLVDKARLYCTNEMGVKPTLIGWKEGNNNLLVDPQEIQCLRTLSMLNEDADSVYELYTNQDLRCQAGSVWKDIVLSPSRERSQQELKIAIQKVENRNS